MAGRHGLNLRGIGMLFYRGVGYLLAAVFLWFGYKNVLRYPGGIFAWKGAKYPIDGEK